MSNADAWRSKGVARSRSRTLWRAETRIPPVRRFALVRKEKLYLGRFHRIASTSALSAAASIGGILVSPGAGLAQDSATSALRSVQGAASEDAGGGGGQTAARRRWFVYDSSKVDFSVGVFGQLTATRTIDYNANPPGETIFQEESSGASPSAGVLGVFHQQFSGWRGYDFNVGYTSLAETHSSGISETGPTSGSAFGKNSTRMNMYEATFGYVVKGPTSNHRLQTFAQGGAGVLLFQPTSVQAKSDARAAFLFGAGVDLRLTDHLGFRIEYRGLLAKTPNYIGSDGGAETSGRLFTVISEPTVSLKYTFGALKRMQ